MLPPEDDMDYFSHISGVLYQRAINWEVNIKEESFFSSPNPCYNGDIPQILSIKSGKDTYVR